MQVITLLKDIFGFESFKPGQQAVVEKIINQKSAVAIFPTGSGKSLCYQLPATQLPGLTLVISPLLSLMQDQLDFLLSHRIKAAKLDHSLSRDEYQQVIQQAKSNQLKILMVSVERFKNERFRAQLQQMQVSLLVVDEAHCISEWGHNFRPDYLKLPQYQQEFGIKQCLLLTATATPKVVADMREKFSVQQEDVVLTGFYRDNLKLQMNPTAKLQRLAVLQERLQANSDQSSIVYVTLQKTAEQVAEQLREQGINAQHYHAGMKPDERSLLQDQFMQGQVACVVATIAFGMGIDKADVRQVIHYDLPKSIENYAQEVGRAGRDDQTAHCEVLGDASSIQIQQNFVYGDTPEQAAITDLLQQISSAGEFWEVKLTALSNELNIRTLPLKTLLVYLELMGVIEPKLTYFESYTFRNLANTADLISQFAGERQQFIRQLFDHCEVKTSWTHVDVDGLMQDYGCERSRVMSALEWFDQQGMIALQAKQAVERFAVLKSEVDVADTSQHLYQLFIDKEQAEINRIDQMLNMFASAQCISVQLAAYFGQQLEFQSCGHCSVCTNGAADFAAQQQLTALSEYDFNQTIHAFKQRLGAQNSVLNMTKFLCGIHSPIFTKLKVRSLAEFGLLQDHPFPDVKAWIEQHNS